MFNDVDLIAAAARAGHGIAFMLEDHVTRYLTDGTLVRVLEDWCDPFDGYYLYYPSRRQPRQHSASFWMRCATADDEGVCGILRADMSFARAQAQLKSGPEARRPPLPFSGVSGDSETCRLFMLVLALQPYRRRYRASGRSHAGSVNGPAWPAGADSSTQLRRDDEQKTLMLASA